MRVLGRALAAADVRHRGEKLPRVLLFRIREELVHRRLLDDLAAVHHDHAIGEVGDDAHVVGDEHDGRAELVAAGAQQLEDLGLHGHVEGRGRLVGDDQPRVEHERHRDDHALLLAARELVRVVVDARLGIGDADLSQDLDRARLRLGVAQLLVSLKAFGDLEPDREHRIEGGGCLLEHHRGIAPAHAAQVVVARVHDVGLGAVAAAHDDGAGERGGLGQEAQQRVSGDGLARA